MRFIRAIALIKRYHIGMDIKTAKKLCEITSAFYRDQAESFSQTRQSPWDGWERCIEAVREDCALVHVSQSTGEAVSHRAREASMASAKSDSNTMDSRLIWAESSLSVFDLACGNLRFLSFLQSATPDAAITYCGVDNCDALVPKNSEIHYQSLGIINILLDGQHLADQIKAPKCDLAVSFGFMHHVPSQEYRAFVLRSLVEQTQPGGYALVSFWQFLNNDSLREKAIATHQIALDELGLRQELADLDEGDFLVGWKNKPGVYRYCHSFSEADINELIESVADKATLAARFTADGRSGNLNTYVVLRVL